MAIDDRPDFRVKMQGYDRSQVDRLVERIQRTLSGAAVRDPVSVVELQYYVYFDVRVRGYDRRRVHEYIDVAIAALRRRALAA